MWKGNSGGDKLEFRQIVLKHLQDILGISIHELRDSTRYINQGNNIQTIESEDTRMGYIQSIENLAYVLTPYFDKKMNSVYPKYKEILTAFKFQMKDILKEEYKEICEGLGKTEIGNDFVIEMKLKYAKELFYQLNLLLFRNDYLKTAVFGEGQDNIVYADDEDDE